MPIDYTNLHVHLQRVKDAAWPFQEDCIAYLKKHPRAVLDSPTGSGKSMMLLTATFLKRPQAILIVCSKNALSTWKKQIEAWFPEYGGYKNYTIIRGTPHTRERLWRKQTLVRVCTYAVLQRDLSHAIKQVFDTIICDEIHRGGARNRKTKGFAAIKALANRFPSIYMASATLASRGPQDLWGYLNIADPKTFNSYWKFLNTFCVMVPGPFGMQNMGAQNGEGLRDLTRHVLYRIPKDVANEQMPPLNRIFIPVEMTGTQERVYKDLEKDMLAVVNQQGKELDKVITEFEETNHQQYDTPSLIMAPTALALITKLRQLLVCPMLLGINEMGAAIETVLDMIEDREDHHVVIFTPFRKAVTLFKEYIREKITPDVFHLWGSMEPEDVAANVKLFKERRGTMICSVQFAESFELETADACFFVGYDWDQNVNHQAEGRLRRLSSKTTHINAYYMQHLGTMDDSVLEVLNRKSGNTKLTFQNIDELRKVLLGEKYGNKTQGESQTQTNSRPEA